MPMGPIQNKKYDPYVVTDDGVPGHRYGVWVNYTSGGYKNVCSGTTLNNASMIAEALQKTSAGNDRTTLTESKRFD